MMLRELKFVLGAVARKDFVASMTHFAIEGGHVRSYNGTLALSSPIAFNIDCKPKAQALVNAVSKCDSTITLSMTAAGRLRVQSGSFTAFVDCITDESPHVLPEGQDFPIDGDAFLACVKTIEPFIGTDASRPWTNGVLLKGQSAFATNNTMLVEYWIGSTIPIPINVPLVAIKEMIRIDEAPIHAQITKDSLTFHYADGRWIRTQLLATEWPDLSRLLDIESCAKPIEPRIFDAINHLKGFCGKEGALYFTDNYIRTHLTDGEGAAFEIEGFNATGCYRHEMLSKLKGVATSIDWSLYPKPCAFFGDRLRGVLVGISM